MFLISAAVLILLFVFTGFMARFYHETERSLARQWSARGDAAMAGGDAPGAIRDYRTALIYTRSNGETGNANDTYDLHLAEALAASNHLDEARSYFLSLAEREPGNAPVNLELARLAARQNNLSDAARYYNAAIFGIWDKDPSSQRRAARIEYTKFLLEHDQAAEAQAQMIALAAALPSASREDAALHVQAGQLLLETGAHSQALAEFRRALQLDRDYADAARGAGMAAYFSADYRAAANYLERASHSAPLAAGEKQLLDTSRDVLALDPFAPSLTVAEQAKRAAHDFAVAQTRARACSANQSGTSASALQRTLAAAQTISPQESYLRQHPEAIAPLMDSVFALENAAAIQCSPPTGDDLALQLLGRSRAGNVQ